MNEWQCKKCNLPDGGVLCVECSEAICRTEWWKMIFELSGLLERMEIPPDLVDVSVNIIDHEKVYPGNKYVLIKRVE